MQLPRFPQRERTFSYAGIILGFAVSLTLAPKNEYFFPNFSFFWLSQLVIVGSVLIFQPRPAIVGALAVVLAAVLVGFQTWGVTWSRSVDGGVWLLYLVLLVGEFVGGVVAAWIGTYQSSHSAVRAALITAVFVLTGSFASSLVACNVDLIYCGR